MLNAITVLLACRFISAVSLRNAEPDIHRQDLFEPYCAKRRRQLIRIPNYSVKNTNDTNNSIINTQTMETRAKVV